MISILVRTLTGSMLCAISLFFISCEKEDTKKTISYTVTFDTEGGSTVQAQTVEKGKTASKPTNPTRTDHTFIGWYQDKGLTQSFDFSKTITTDITLYAKWEKKPQTTPPSEKPKYRITITFKLNESQHGMLPGGIHFTGIFSAVHNSDFTLYAVGKILSAGMEQLAETGATGGIVNEAKALAGKSILKHEVSPSSYYGPEGRYILDNIEVSPAFPYVSIATMIAPTPDWFVGLNVKLYENGAYKTTRLTGNIGVYDGGTEEGTGFSLSNPSTDPKEPVSKLTSMNGVDIDFTQKPIGTYVIETR